MKINVGEEKCPYCGKLIIKGLVIGLAFDKKGGLSIGGELDEYNYEKDRYNKEKKIKKGRK